MKKQYIIPKKFYRCFVRRNSKGSESARRKRKIKGSQTNRTFVIHKYSI